jgi:hypothetical protein
VKEKTTGPSPVKSFTINNNELISVFFRTISKGLKQKFITSIVNFNKNKEMSHQVGWTTKQLERGSNDQHQTHQSIRSSRRQEQHTKISSRSDHKRSFNFWRKWLCRKLYFSLFSHCLVEALFSKLIFFTLSRTVKLQAFFSFSFSYFFFYVQLVTSHALCVTCTSPTETKVVVLVSFWLMWIGPPRRRDHPTNLPLPTTWHLHVGNIFLIISKSLYANELT